MISFYLIICKKISSKIAETPKKSWFDGLKSEFHKIIWPDKTELGKETLAVAVVSILLGVLIAVVDFVVQYGIDFLVK